MNVEFALKLRIYRSLKSLICLKWIRKKLSTTLHTQFNLTLHSRSLPLNLWEMRMHMHVHVFRTKNRHRSTVKAQEWLKKQTHWPKLWWNCERKVLIKIPKIWIVWALSIWKVNNPFHHFFVNILLSKKIFEQLLKYEKYL